MYKDTTIIMPTLNEAENIGELLEQVQHKYPNISIIVVDDGSKDGTQQIVKRFTEKNQRIGLVDRSTRANKGLTASVIDGVLLAKTPITLVMDADFQHPSETIQSIVSKIREGNDVVVASRASKPLTWRFSRLLISNAAILLGRIRLKIGGAYVRDVVSGFFGARTKLFQQQIAKHSNSFIPEGYKVCLDLLKTLPENTRVTEIPYAFALRKEGASKMGKKQIIAYIKSLLS